MLWNLCTSISQEFHSRKSGTERKARLWRKHTLQKESFIFTSKCFTPWTTFSIYPLVFFDTHTQNTKKETFDNQQQHFDWFYLTAILKKKSSLSLFISCSKNPETTLKSMSLMSLSILEFCEWNLLFILSCPSRLQMLPDCGWTSSLFLSANLQTNITHAERQSNCYWNFTKTTTYWTDVMAWDSDNKIL